MVYAVVSKTTDCNDHVGSSPSLGTLVSMDVQVLAFLSTHQISTLTTMLYNDSPHAAAIHYSLQENPLRFFFCTDKKSRKCEKLLVEKTTKASLVIGQSEEEWKTFQADGNVVLETDENELQTIKTIHFSMHPRAKEFENDPDTAFLVFTPTWWRYSDFKTSPPTVITN